MDILDDMGVSKLSAKVFLKVNYSLNGVITTFLIRLRSNQYLTFCYKLQT